MSGYVVQAVDAIEPISQYVWETAANQGLYNVINGCGLTYNGGNMNVDLAAGAVTLFGATVPVAATSNAFTLVSDPSNPRWTWLAISSAGAAVVVSGTPAAAPAVPSFGDRVPLALVYVDAALTVANNASYKIDQRIPGVEQKHIWNYTNATQTVSASTALVNVTGALTSGSTTTAFSFDAAASASYLVDYKLLLNFTGTGGAKFQIAGPSSPTAVKITGTASVWTTGGDQGPVQQTEVTAFATNFAAHNAAVTTVTIYNTNFADAPLDISFYLKNGSTAGAVTLQYAQNSANGTTVIGTGSKMNVYQIA